MSWCTGTGHRKLTISAEIPVGVCSVWLGCDREYRSV